MKNLYLVILLLLQNLVLIGQDVGIRNPANSGLSWGQSSVSASQVLGDVFKVRIFDDVEGSVYLFDTWNNLGRILTKKNEKLVLHDFNLNLETGNFETQFSKDSIFVFNSISIKEVDIADKIFVKKADGFSGAESFYELIFHKNGFKVYQKPILQKKEGVFNPLTQEKTPDELSVGHKYFVEKANANIVEFKLKKKDIHNIVSDNKELTIKFVKKQKLKYNNLDDVIRIFDYYNSL